MAGMIATFVLVALLLCLVPGPDTLLVLRVGLRGGRRDGTTVGLGCAAGSLVWGSAAAVGIAALLQRSAEAFEVVKLLGAAYLIVLGGRTLWAARRSGSLPFENPPEPATGAGRSVTGTFARGLVSDLLNPKVGLFYVAVIPQVVPHGIPILRATLMFAGVDTIIAALYMVALAAATEWALHRLRQTRIRRAMEVTTAGCMIGLGVAVAFDHGS